MNQPGVYKIQSRVKSDRCYIGSAKNISKRWWNHLYWLRKDKHHSIKLQRHFDKYGESDLQFSILVGCNKEDLIKVEQWFLDMLKPWFNILLTAKKGGGMRGRHHTKESKLKSSKSHKGKNIWSGKKISQYDRIGNFIEDFDSSLQAEMKTGVDSGNIRNCLKDGRKYAGGYVWKYKNVI